MATAIGSNSTFGYGQGIDFGPPVKPPKTKGQKRAEQRKRAKARRLVQKGCYTYAAAQDFHAEQRGIKKGDLLHVGPSGIPFGIALGSAKKGDPMEVRMDAPTATDKKGNRMDASWWAKYWAKNTDPGKGKEKPPEPQAKPGNSTESPPDPITAGAQETARIMQRRIVEAIHGNPIEPRPGDAQAEVLRLRAKVVELMKRQGELAEDLGLMKEIRSAQQAQIRKLLPFRDQAIQLDAQVNQKTLEIEHWKARTKEEVAALRVEHKAALTLLMEQNKRLSGERLEAERLAAQRLKEMKKAIKAEAECSERLIAAEARVEDAKRECLDRQYIATNATRLEKEAREANGQALQTIQNLRTEAEQYRRWKKELQEKIAELEPLAEVGRRVGLLRPGNRLCHASKGGAWYVHIIGGEPEADESTPLGALRAAGIGEEKP